MPDDVVRGRVVAITGAARGIGLSVARAFRDRGAEVFLGDLDGDLAVREATALGGAGCELDVRSATSFAAFLGRARAEADRVDVLVNNAGIMPLGGFAEQTEATSDAVVDINLRGVMTGMRLVLPDMLGRGDGHIINIASMLGKVPALGAATYCATKFGVIGLSRAVRDEVAGTGVTVSAVLPAAVRTELIAGMRQGGLMPTVDPEDVALAAVRSCGGRRDVVTVPRWLGCYDLAAALLPERMLAPVRRRLVRAQVSTVDFEGRAEYSRRISAIESGGAAERDDPAS